MWCRNREPSATYVLPGLALPIAMIASNNYMIYKDINPRAERSTEHGEGNKNYFAGTRLAASRVRLMPLSRSSSAKVADMCSVRPSHSST